MLKGLNGGPNGDILQPTVKLAIAEAGTQLRDWRRSRTAPVPIQLGTMQLLRFATAFRDATIGTSLNTEFCIASDKSVLPEWIEFSPVLLYPAECSYPPIAIAGPLLQNARIRIHLK